MQLAVADVDGEHEARTIGEQHFGEAAGRSADIEADMALDIDRIVLERAGELDAAARDIGMRRLGRECSAGRDDLGRFGDLLAVGGDDGGVDLGLCLLWGI